MRTNAIQFLSENFKNDNGDYNFREFVIMTSQSDPGFFRWLFNNENLGDFECADEQAFSDFLDSLPTVFRASDIEGGVATFNADPFCIEGDSVDDVMAEIEDNGIEELTGEDLADAQAKLDIDDPFRRCYRAGDCLFSLDDDRIDERFAVAYYPDHDVEKYVGSLQDYQDGGVAAPILMSEKNANELMSTLNEYVKTETIGKNEAENRAAHNAYERGDWGFNIVEF